jgi:ADP-ribose pyrophosphatase YjhB (NUDIX family)
MTARKKNMHCSYCGHAYSPDQVWPRACSLCGNISYLNPLPVGVTLLPVDGGLLCIRRTIEPAVGEVALPGGFLEVGETWQEGCARELREETGIHIEAAEVRLFRVYSAAREGLVLVFGLAGARRLADLPAFVHNEEVSERMVLHAPQRLAFPLHTRVLEEYFHERDRGTLPTIQ